MAQKIDRQFAELDAALEAYIQKKMPAAVVSALNKAAPLAKTRTIRGTAKRTKLPQKLIHKRVYNRKASIKTLKAQIRAYVQGVSAIQLKTRDTAKGGWKNRKGKGVTAKGRRWGNAFIANTPKGKPHVFQRKGSARLPIEVVRIDIADDVQAVAPKAATRIMQQRFPGLLQHEILRRLK